MQLLPGCQRMWISWSLLLTLAREDSNAAAPDGS